MIPAFARRATNSRGTEAGASVTTITPARARDERVGVFLLHRADEFGRMHALAPQVDERPLDMDSERAGNAIARLSRGRERRGQHARRVGHDRRQEGGHAGAAMRGGDRGDPLDGRIGVEQHAAAAIDLPVDEAGAENSAAEIDLLAAARAVFEAGRAPGSKPPSTTSAQSSCSRSPSKRRAP